MKEGVRLYQMKVFKVERLGNGFRWIVLDAGEEFKFKMGQYVSLRVSEKGERREYSIAGREGEKRICLLVDVGPGGVGSKFIEGFKKGDRVDVLGPLGDFMVRKEDEKLVMVATGSGIAPLKVMVEEEIKKGKKVWLVWGMRHEEDVFWKEMFEEREERFGGFEFNLILSKAGKNWQGKMGHVQDVLQDNLGDWLGAGFYICGKKEVVDDIEKWLVNNGVKSELIRKENF